MSWWIWVIIAIVVIAALGAIRFELPPLRRYLRMKGM